MTMPSPESHPSQFTKCHWCYLVCLYWACFFLLLISISTPQCRLFSFFSEIIANDVLVCNLISSNSFSTLLLVILWTENFIIIFPCLKFKRFPLGEKTLPDTVYLTLKSHPECCSLMISHSASITFHTLGFEWDDLKQVSTEFCQGF